MLSKQDKSRTVIASLDEKIAKLTELRGLLADPAVSALFEEIVQAPLALASFATPRFGNPGSYDHSGAR